MNVKKLPFLMIISLFLVGFNVDAEEEQTTERSWVGYDLEYADGLTVDNGEDILWEDLSVFTANITVIGSLTARNCTIINEGYLWNRGNVTLSNCTTFTGVISNYGILDVIGIEDEHRVLDNGSKLVSLYDRGNALFTYQIPGARSKIERSTLVGFEISGGILDVLDSVLINCTIMNNHPFSSFNNFTMYGNGTGIAMFMVSSDEIDGIRLFNYSTGISYGNFSLWKRVEIGNCHIGVVSVMGSANFSRCNFVNNSINLMPERAVNIYDSIFNGGKLFLHDKGKSNLLRNNFIKVQGILNQTGGLFSGNTLSSCEYGLVEPYSVSIRKNTFKECGIALKDDDNCTIFHNSFIDNDRNAKGFVNSNWFNESTGEGNYYSNYNGKDDGSNGRRAHDGIGDTNLPFNGRDPYPLMEDGYWNMPVIPELDLLYVVGSANVELFWGQGSATGFILQRSTSLDFSRYLRTWSLPAPFSVVHDNPNETVYFRIRPYNGNGSRGWSLPVSVNINRRPLYPINIRVDPVPEGNGLIIEWDWSGEDIYKALIYYGEGDQTPRVRESLYPENRIVVGELKNGIDHNITLQTMDHIGLYSKRSPPTTAVPSDAVPPPPPRDLSAIATSNASVMLNWNPPMIQDIVSYLVYRKEPLEKEMEVVGNIAKSRLSYEDMDLKDNTSYVYAMASVDDDGPVSELTPYVSIRTEHYNSCPYLIGRDQIIYLVEDDAPGSLLLTPLFRDDDGDELELTIVQSYPFQANIIGDTLWVSPGPDEAGEGYVEISASDGETSSKFLIGVLVEPRPDPPRDVRILSPLNGSVILPGTSIKLQGTAFDPDVGQGDMLNVTWISDREGMLSKSFQGNTFALVELQPGPHIITMIVRDRTGHEVKRSIMIILSLWGWGSIPWNIAMGDARNLDAEGRSGLELTVQNQSPFILRFLIEGTIGDEPGVELARRMILVGPSTDGKIMIELPVGLEKNIGIMITLRIEGETINGTYAGSSRIEDIVVIDGSAVDEKTDLWIPVVTGVSTIFMIAILVYLFIISRKKRETDIPKI
ncbi:MAG: fibronectin type III domain-containing protein [Candidatus Thermoplasmatota archaeon]|nr:fibronectin type III domain-containing protein [Candidatus Thermoplasmatota archaeon]